MKTTILYNISSRLELSTKWVYPTLLISLVALFAFYKYVLQIFPSIMTQQLMASFHLSGAGLGNLAATFYYAYLIMQFFVGFILDKFNLRVVVTSAILSCALGVLLFSCAHTNVVACFARSFMGLGVAFAPIAYMKIASMWVPKRFYAFANGLMAASCMLGAVFGESILSHVVSDLGWRPSLFAIAVFGMILAVLACTFIKAEKNINTGITSKSVKSIFYNKQNWLLCLYGGFAFSPLAIFGGLWGNIFLQQAYTLNQHQSASLISLIFLGFALGSPVLGMLSDWYGNRKYIMVVGTIFSLAFLVSVIYANHQPLWLLQCCLFGFGFGLGCYMLVFTIGKEINSLALTATVAAFINASEAILDSITEPLIGKLLDLSGKGSLAQGAQNFSLVGYHQALVILLAFMLISIILLGWIKNPK